MSSEEKTNPPSFLSLPEDIVLDCIARILRSYYPKLSLVSKSLRSILSSRELLRVRYHLKIRENCVYICLQSSTDHNLSWFNLWIKPGVVKETSIKTMLVPTPSSHIPTPTIQVGSKIYEIGGQNIPSSVVRIRNKMSYDNWSKAPSMKVARKNALTCVLDEKIYVMGGCRADESTNWAEVFDTKTQLWELLPDPGSEVRGSLFRKIDVLFENLYLCVQYRYHVYDPRVGKWRVNETGLQLDTHCVTKSEHFAVLCRTCYRYDSKDGEWKEVIDLIHELDKYDGNGMVHIANYGGKLLMLWEHVEPCDNSNKEIWCAVVALERGNDDEVWGKLEWVNLVRTVPSSNVFLRCIVDMV